MPGGKFARQTHFYLPNLDLFSRPSPATGPTRLADGFTEPDMILKPDYTNATPAPWTADTTLQVIHDIDDQKGTPVPYAPRNVLKRDSWAFYNARGLQPIVAPEMEFYLVRPNTDPPARFEPPMGRSGRRADRAGRYSYRRMCSMSAVDEYGKVIDDIYDYAEAMGLEIDGILQGGRRGPDRAEPAPRRSRPAGRRDCSSSSG